MTDKAKKPRETHSVRCPGETWDAARQRAAFEGKSINAAVRLLIEGYAEGQFTLPRTVKVYATEPEKVSA